uniref:C-C motif chemokine n=1 Tax=Poecilia latipinna TaxID=48699 RepID=A0A3B3V7K3_9TELE
MWFEPTVSGASPHYTLSKMSAVRNHPYLCCTRNYEKPISLKHISSYFTTGPQCPTQGLIFVTVKQRHVCVNSQKPWVLRSMKNLEKRPR